MKFSDVLDIKNGRNQKQVENPNGQYPIYGSGGVMGWADSYICEAHTVVIGRKGTINNPIYVDRPFWNVDTAFGLVANRNILLPKYLFYFCCNFDFEKLNTTVTIPSLTKSNLLNIEIDVPSLEIQGQVVDRLDKIEDLIKLRKEQLRQFDQIVKSRFIELFGDMLLNNMAWPEAQLCTLADVVSGITKGRKLRDTELFEVPYMAVSNVKDGYIDWTTVKTILASKQEIEQYRLMPYDVLMTEGGDPDKLGRGAVIINPLKNSIHQNHIFRVRLNTEIVLPIFFSYYLQQQKAKRYFLGCAKQTTGIASINMKQLRALPVLLPSMELQIEFATFVEQTDKLKLAVTEALAELETLKKSLMQQYFG